jgi:hypothetical protein
VELLLAKAHGEDVRGAKPISSVAFYALPFLVYSVDAAKLNLV